MVQLDAHYKHSRKHNRYQIVKLEDGMTFEQLDRMLRREKDGVVVGGYAALDTQTITAQTLPNEAEVSVVNIGFSSAVLFDATAELNDSDRAGCLLDRATMYQLFGTGRADGQWVLYENRCYQVRGLVESEESLLVIRNADDEDAVDSIVLDCEEELYRNQFFESYVYGYNPTGEVWYIADYNGFGHWIQTPNQWSDFAFWTAFAKQVRGRWEHMVYDNKDVVERVCYRALWRRLEKEGGAVILFFGGVFLLKVALPIRNILTQGTLALNGRSLRYVTRQNTACK